MLTAAQSTALYVQVYVHILKHTDIRHVHRSLYDRKHCLGLFMTTYVAAPLAAVLSRVNTQ